MATIKNYDSEFCGNLPLHHVNLIQSYGYLLVLDKTNYKIIQGSENFAEISGKSIQDIVNTDLSDYIDPDGVKQLKKKFSTDIKDKIPLTLTFGQQRVLAVAHVKHSYLLLEIERLNDEQERFFTDVFQEIKYAMAAIEAANSVEEVSRIAIHELKKLSGFDGIMMYRFDEQWNGTVIAEEKENGLEEYLGLTFPASDVPKQARELYLKNPYRLIPDRDYKPVRLYPVINPLTNTFIDLSDCNLRSVAAVHIEYLKNMGVQASMSIRIINNGKLWGLISCHHKGPRFLNFEVCSVFELLSSVVSNKISAILHKENYDFVTSLQEKRASLIEQIYAEDDVIKGLLNDQSINILDVFEATGAMIMLDGINETIGTIPDADSVENLTLWLQGKNFTKIFSTDNLSGIYDEAAEYADVASGILVIPVNAESDDYILCFRPEVVQTINWGGDPDTRINFEPDGKNYHPRNSFKLWQQTVNKISKPWQALELEAAEALRSFIFEFTTRQA